MQSPPTRRWLNGASWHKREHINVSARANWHFRVGVTQSSGPSIAIVLFHKRRGIDQLSTAASVIGVELLT
jgi:hypothetical protein